MGDAEGQTVLFGGVHSLPSFGRLVCLRVSPQQLHDPLERALHAWTSCLQLSAWGVSPPAQTQTGLGVQHLPLSQQGFCSPQPDRAPCLQWEIQKLTFLKKGPAQIKHADGVSRSVRGLTGRWADGKSRLPNSSAVILPKQCCREVQEL